MKTMLVYISAMPGGSCPRFGQSTTLTHTTYISYAHNTHDPTKNCRKNKYNFKIMKQIC